MYNVNHQKCLNCGRTPEDGAKFGVRVDTKKPDDLCVKCRFDAIDAKHASQAGVRSDMREYGVPVVGRSHNLRFEPGADSVSRGSGGDGDDDGEGRWS